MRAKVGRFDAGHGASGGSRCDKPIRTLFSSVTTAKIGVWAQGSVWRKDGKVIVVQATHEKELQVFSFDGKRAKMTGTVKLNNSPVGIRTSQQ